jgi:hypothetical protein
VSVRWVLLYSESNEDVALQLFIGQAVLSEELLDGLSLPASDLA